MIFVDEYEIDFRNSLLYIWIEIKQIVDMEKNQQIPAESDLTRLKMQKMADKLYKQFKNTPIPIQKIPYVYQNYYSMTILFQDGSGMAIPYHFYQQANLKNPPDFEELFEREDSWLDLLSNIFELGMATKTNITNADIKILRALTYYKRNGLFNDVELTNRRNFLFQLKTLAKMTNLSQVWITERLMYLQNNYVLRQYYILNPFIFGLKTFVITYDKKFDDESTILDNISLFKLTLSFKEILRVIQLPSVQVIDDFKLSFPIEIKKTNDVFIYNNLAELHEDENKSFLKVPKFDSPSIGVSKAIVEFKESNNDYLKLYEVDDKDENLYPLMKKMSKARRNSILVRILNYLAKWGSMQENFKKASKELRMNSLEFLEATRFLFNNDVIAFFPRITRIGSNNRYGILIIDHTGKQSEKIKQLFYNILELPHSMTFIGDDFLFAYISIPDSYTSFFRYLNKLQDSLEVQYSLFVSLKSWGRFSIPLPEGTTVDEYGVHFPNSIFKEIKNESL